MADGGYIKLWRKIVDWPLFRQFTAEQRWVVAQLLMDANWRDEYHYDKRTRQTILVPRGSLVASERQIAASANVGRQVVRTVINHLAGNPTGNPRVNPTDPPFLTQGLTQGVRILTILNYDHYQSSDRQANPTPNPAPTHKLTQGVTQGLTQLLYLEEGEEGEEGKKIAARKLAAAKQAPSKKKPKQVVAPDLLLPPEAYRAVELLRELILSYDPENSCGGQRWSKQRWAKDMAELQRTMAAQPIPWGTIEAELRFALSRDEDPYWRRVVKSPGSYAKHRDTIRDQLAKHSAPAEKDRLAAEWGMA